MWVTADSRPWRWFNCKCSGSILDIYITGTLLSRQEENCLCIYPALPLFVNDPTVNEITLTNCPTVRRREFQWVTNLWTMLFIFLFYWENSLFKSRSFEFNSTKRSNRFFEHYRHRFTEFLWWQMTWQLLFNYLKFLCIHWFIMDLLIFVLLLYCVYLCIALWYYQLSCVVFFLFMCNCCIE